MNNKIIDDKFLTSLESVVLNLKSSLKGFFGGNHKTNLNGSSVEFSDFREYILGDDLRKIDWNLYSRFEKHFIKLFVDERQMHNTIYIDSSASMGSVSANKTKACLQVAAALGFLSVQCLDKLSYKIINDNNVQNLGGKIIGKDAFYKSMQELEQIEFKGTSKLSEAICNEGDLEKSDGASIIISDFLFDEDYKKGIDYLLYQNKEVMVIQVLSMEEISPTINGRYMLLDSEAPDKSSDMNMKMKISRSEFEAYKMALKDFLEDVKHFCASRGVSYALVTTDKPVVNQLFESLYESVVTK